MRFKERDIESFWIDCERFKPRRVPPELRKVLFRKLKMLDAAEASGSLNDLRIPPEQQARTPRGRSSRPVQHQGESAVATVLHLDRVRDRRS